MKNFTQLLELIDYPLKTKQLSISAMRLDASDKASPTEEKENHWLEACVSGTYSISQNAQKRNVTLSTNRPIDVPYHILTSIMKMDIC